MICNVLLNTYAERALQSPNVLRNRVAIAYGSYWASLHLHCINYRAAITDMLLQADELHC